MARKRVGKNIKRDKLSSSTDDEFVSMVRRELNISSDETRELIKTFIECLRKCIDINGHINLRRLGKFYISTSKRGKFRNFQGHMVDVPILYMLKFSASDSLRRMINRKVKIDKDKKLGEQSKIL